MVVFRLVMKQRPAEVGGMCNATKDACRDNGRQHRPIAMSVRYLRFLGLEVEKDPKTVKITFVTQSGSTTSQLALRLPG